MSALNGSRLVGVAVSRKTTRQPKHRSEHSNAMYFAEETNHHTGSVEAEQQKHGRWILQRQTEWLNIEQLEYYHIEQ